MNLEFSTKRLSMAGRWVTLGVAVIFQSSFLHGSECALSGVHLSVLRTPWRELAGSQHRTAGSSRLWRGWSCVSPWQTASMWRQGNHVGRCTGSFELQKTPGRATNIGGRDTTSPVLVSRDRLYMGQGYCCQSSSSGTIG